MTTKKSNKKGKGINSDRKNRSRDPSGQPKLQLASKKKFLLEAGLGCHIARHDCPDSDWVLGWESVDPEDYCWQDDEDGEENNGFDQDEEMDDNYNVPDLAIDPINGVLSVCNLRDVHVVAYISVRTVAILDRFSNVLLPGTTVDSHGTAEQCTTLIVLCPPRTFAHLGVMKDILENDTLSLDDLKLDSDVQEWKQHTQPDDTHSQAVSFPLQCGCFDSGNITNNTLDHVSSSSSSSSSSNIIDKDRRYENAFLCTQSEDGELTHFFAGSYHAIDFACSVGTPLLAVADSIVIDVKDNEQHLTGIAVSNLFSWNSILLQVKQDDSAAVSSFAKGHETSVTAACTFSGGPLFVEYVHIARSTVKVGDHVVAGQVIGSSGSIGFSPEPHLHFCAYRSQDPTAPTVRVLFQSEKCSQSGKTKQTTYLPQAGHWYNVYGEVQ